MQTRGPESCTAFVEGPKGARKERKEKEKKGRRIDPKDSSAVRTAGKCSREDIRAAPMLLLRMFDTPHRTVAAFPTGIKAVCEVGRTPSTICYRYGPVRGGSQLAPIYPGIGTLQACRSFLMVLEARLKAHCSHGGYALAQSNPSRAVQLGRPFPQQACLSISGYNR